MIAASKTISILRVEDGEVSTIKLHLLNLNVITQVRFYYPKRNGILFFFLPVTDTFIDDEHVSNFNAGFPLAIGGAVVLSAVAVGIFVHKNRNKEVIEVAEFGSLLDKA